MHKYLAKLSSLSVNNPSPHPAPNDSSRIQSESFKENAPSPHQAEEPLITNVIVKHSSGFNSKRASGMNNFQQLQSIQITKSLIIDEAPMIFTQFVNFKVITTRVQKTCFAAPTGFCDSAMHTAILTAGSEKEREYLANAVEDLWGKLLSKAGGMCGEYVPVVKYVGVCTNGVKEGIRVGDRFPVQAQIIEAVEEVTRIEWGTALTTQM